MRTDKENGRCWVPPAVLVGGQKVNLHLNLTYGSWPMGGGWKLGKGPKASRITNIKVRRCLGSPFTHHENKRSIERRRIDLPYKQDCDIIHVLSLARRQCVVLYWMDWTGLYLVT